MVTKEVLDSIVKKMNPRDVPAEFISCVKVKTPSGASKVLKGEELADYMESPHLYPAAEARFVILYDEFYSKIRNDIAEVYEQVRVLQDSRTN